MLSINELNSDTRRRFIVDSEFDDEDTIGILIAELHERQHCYMRLDRKQTRVLAEHLNKLLGG